MHFKNEVNQGCIYTCMLQRLCKRVTRHLIESAAQVYAKHDATCTSGWALTRTPVMDGDCRPPQQISDLRAMLSHPSYGFI